MDECILMGCTSSRELLVLPENFYLDITRDLIIKGDNKEDQMDKLSSITYRVMKMYNNKELYNKDDRETLEALYMKVMERQEREEDRRRIEGSFRRRREEQLEASITMKEREQLDRMRKARQRNITW